MDAKTTLYMHGDNYMRLNQASMILGISRSIIIRILLKKMMDDSDELGKAWSTVKYQRGDEKARWGKFHLTLHAGEYEYCMDLRKFYKMSLSFIVAFAIGKYLPVMMQQANKRPKQCSDNSPYTNYMISKRIKQGVICWEICWGILPELADYIQAYT